MRIDNHLIFSDEPCDGDVEGMAQAHSVEVAADTQATMRRWSFGNFGDIHT